MNAQLYLKELTQEQIDIDSYQGTYGNVAWTLCCDAFCCILDFSANLTPEDLVTRSPVDRTRLSVGFKTKRLDWMLREESFGGLLWNTSTGHVFQLDPEAYGVLSRLEKGASLREIAEQHEISESDIHQLLADISRTEMQPPERVSE